MGTSNPSPAFLQNPHLNGDSFLLPGGPSGVLLLHGFTATTAEVRLLGGFLHEKGYTVSAPLLPGHGTNPEDLNRCQWQDWAAEVARAYQDLAGRCEQVVVGGTSMGALLAIHFVAHHPEVSALMLYAPALETSSPLEKWMARILAPFVPYRVKASVSPSPADLRWKGYSVYPLPAAVQFFKLQAEARRCLPLVRRPLLLIQGRLDQRVDPSVPQLMIESVRSAVKELHWLSNSGHVVLLDQEWEQAAGLSLAFLQRVLN